MIPDSDYSLNCKSTELSLNEHLMLSCPLPWKLEEYCSFADFFQLCIHEPHGSLQVTSDQQAKDSSLNSAYSMALFDVSTARGPMLWLFLETQSSEQRPIQLLRGVFTASNLKEPVQI